jgi:hypothetical protein
VRVGGVGWEEPALGSMQDVQQAVPVLHI